MITPDEVADLLPGDEVELVVREHPHGEVLVRGKLHSINSNPRALFVADYGVRARDLQPIYASKRSLRVLNRVPRPEKPYVNQSSRTEPYHGDVVSFPPDSHLHLGNTWAFTRRGWISTRTGELIGSDMPTSMHLLIDGETGKSLR